MADTLPGLPTVVPITVEALNGNVWISVLIDGTPHPLLELTTREADVLSGQIHATVTEIVSGRRR